MKKILALGVVAVLAGCAKTPTACFTVPSSAEVDEYVNLDAGCSENAEWYDFTANGEVISSGPSGATHKFTAPGTYEIKMTAYAKWEGTMNTRQGTCTGCKGRGKNSSTSRSITITE